MRAQSISYVPHFATPWTVAHQTPLSMVFSRQEYQSKLPFPPPGDLPNPGKEPALPVIPALQVDSVHAEPAGKPLLEINWDLNYICKGSFSQIRENIHSFQELGYWAYPLRATHYRSFPCTRHCPKHLIYINPSISQQPNDIGYYFGPYWGKEAQSH